MKFKLLLSDKLIHHHIMTKASSHNKQMKNLMGAEILVFRIEQR